MTTHRSIAQWQDFVQGCLDFKPEQGVYRIAREMFTDQALFDLEMEMIFEKQWIFACHESQIANPNDFITMQAGRQPMIITRDGKGELHAMANTC
ncbi:MAG: Rieske 2Fe-2S domain-containing protein, partial [Oceanisphaera sp.]